MLSTEALTGIVGNTSLVQRWTVKNYLCAYIPRLIFNPLVDTSGLEAGEIPSIISIETDPLTGVGADSEDEGCVFGRFGNAVPLTKLRTLFLTVCHSVPARKPLTIAGAYRTMVAAADTAVATFET